jgi:hypothetical protein
VRISGGPLKTLIGEREVLYTLTIENHSQSNVAILGGSMASNGRKYPAELCDAPTRTVIVSGASSLVHFLISLGDEPAFKALGEKITWDLRIRIGGKETDVMVEMSRGE